MKQIERAERFAEALSKTIAEDLPGLLIENPQTAAILVTLRGIIVLQMEIYRELKKDLTKIGSQT